MVKTIFLVLGGIFIALILGFFVAYLNLFILLKLKMKKIPKNMQELIDEYKKDAKEVKDARSERESNKNAKSGAGERKIEQNLRTRANQGNTFIRKRVLLPVSEEIRHPKQAVKLNRPDDLSSYTDTF